MSNSESVSYARFDIDLEFYLDKEAITHWILGPNSSDEED